MHRMQNPYARKMCSVSDPAGSINEWCLPYPEANQLRKMNLHRIRIKH